MVKILSFIGMILIIVLVVGWIISLANYNGSDQCDGYKTGECTYCPFPCDKEKP